MVELAWRLACSATELVASAEPVIPDTLIRLRSVLFDGGLPFKSNFQPRRNWPLALTRSPLASAVKLPTWVNSCAPEALPLGVVMKNPSPAIERSVGEEVDSASPFLVTSWPITAVTPAEAVLWAP